MASLERLHAELEDFREARQRATTARLQTLLDTHISSMDQLIQSATTAPPAVGVPVATTAVMPNSTSAAIPATAASTLAYKTIDSYGWDETDTAVKLYVNLPGCGDIQQSEVALECTGTSMRFRLSNAQTPRQLLVTPLKKEIRVKEGTIKCKANAVVITLKKKENGKWWELLDKLAGTEKKTSGGSKAPGEAAAADDAGADPGGSIMKLMKQMYDDGDEEMKRTIGKAWTESREKQMKDIPDF